MTYADGTPFFYLGDTHWGLYLEEYDQPGPHAGNTGATSHFKYLVDRRVEQGFTVCQSEPIGAKFNLADGRVDQKDIDGLRQADKYYQYIADKGLVHANAEFFFSSSMSAKLASDDAALAVLSRYWVARFGAYPVMWTLAQEIDNDFYHGSTGAGGYFRKLSGGIISEPNSYVLAYLEGDKLGSAKTPSAIAAALEQTKPLLYNIYEEIVKLRTAEESLYNTRQLLLKNLYSLALLNKLGQLVGQYSRDNEIVHISEFNQRISEVVQDEPAPFIYERIGNRYSNYLIDEFQDTSRLQWQNLVPLVENGVASGHTSLVVGDGKQAIYRFRQGDVEQFISLPHVDNPIHGRLLEHPGTSTVTQLEHNFRTARTIVEFNNDFFDWAVRNRFADNPTLQSIYIGESDTPLLVQSPVKEGGYVQAGFYDLDGDRTPIWDEILFDIQYLTAAPLPKSPPISPPTTSPSYRASRSCSAKAVPSC